MPHRIFFRRAVDTFFAFQSSASLLLIIAVVPLCALFTISFFTGGGVSLSPSARLRWWRGRRRHGIRRPAGRATPRHRICSPVVEMVGIAKRGAASQTHKEGGVVVKRVKSTHKEGGVRGKGVTSLTDLEPYSTSASSSDDTSPERRKRRRRRTPSSRNARKNEDLLTCSQDNKILDDKLSKQSTENKDDNSEMRKLLEKILENQNVQNKELEKVLENQNVQGKELEKIRKQLELHTNGTSHASDAPRSQSNQLQPPRYRLVFTSGNIGDRIEKGQTIDISVALVEGNNDQTVENGPLASATVELVVVNAEFNQHDNQHNWSREDFESYVKKPRRGNMATRDVDQPEKSIVSNGRFNLVHGAKCHRGSTIFENSGNKKVRLGVIVVSPTEERVLEGLSNSFFVRGHDRPGRQNNLRHNSSNRQRQALVDNDYQEQNNPMTNLPHLSRINAGNRLDMIGGRPQLPIPATEPSTNLQAWRQAYLDPAMTRVPQAICRQSGLDMTGGPSQLPIPATEPSTNLQALITSYPYPNSLLVDQAFGEQNDTRFNTNPTTLAVQLVWDRPNVELSKRHWNLLDQLMPLPKFNNCGLPTTCLMQEHLDSLTIISKEVMQTRRNRGVIIEPLEPDDSDEEQQLKRKMCSKYKLRFANKVCEAYHTRDPIKADDGSLLKVALFDENRKITYGPLSSASVQIVVLHGDFNNHGQDYWTSEEFSRYEVCPRPGEEASSVLGGNCILVLADGEACLGDAFFQMTSYCARTGKFKMGVRLASAQEERIQEGVSEPFWVKDRHFAAEEEPKQSQERLDDSLVVSLLTSEKSNSEPWEYTLHHYVLLMAMVAATLMYAAAFSPPGECGRTPATAGSGTPTAAGTWCSSTATPPRSSRRSWPSSSSSSSPCCTRTSRRTSGGAPPSCPCGWSWCSTCSASWVPTPPAPAGTRSPPCTARCSWPPSSPTSWSRWH